MQITNSFDVPAGVDEVWEMFHDVRSLVACMPGVELTDQLDEQTYRGKMTIRLGPMKPKFEGEARVEFEEATRTGHIDAKGKDKGGGSLADARVDFVIKPTASGSTVELISMVNLKGQLAQFGRTNLLADVSEQLTAQFAACLAAKVAAPTQVDADAVVATELKPLAQVAALVSTRFRRLVRRIGNWLITKVGDD